MVGRGSRTANRPTRFYNLRRLGWLGLSCGLGAGLVKVGYLRVSNDVGQRPGALVPGGFTGGYLAMVFVKETRFICFIVYKAVESVIISVGRRGKPVIPWQRRGVYICQLKAWATFISGGPHPTVRQSQRWSVVIPGSGEPRRSQAVTFALLLVTGASFNPHQLFRNSKEVFKPLLQGSY